MALFFDAVWFDARLAAAGLPREALAAALGLSADEIAELWKDQRELSERDVRVLAGLFGVTPEEVASRAGVSTPVPETAPADAQSRLARLERELVDIKALLAGFKAGRR